MTIYLDGLGNLKRHSDIPEWLVTSNPIPVPYFSLKEMEFVLDESLVTPEVPADLVFAVKRFLSLRESDRLDASAMLYRHYQEASTRGCFVPVPHRAAEDLWNFVTPSEVHLERDSRTDAKLYLRACCECG